MDVFRIFRPSGERKDDRPEKRRAQVRRAQQTYRLRKDQYTKSLEHEVARLRTVETSLVSENQDLVNTIRTLGDMLADCGIHIELPTFDSNGREASNTSGVLPTDASCDAREQPNSELSLTQPHRDGHLSWPDFSQISYSAGWQDKTSITFTDFNVPTILTTSCPWRLRLGDLDPTTVGMEFVLALEEPCLNHIHGDPEKPDHPTGHALTVSSQLLSISPSYPPSSLSSSPTETLNEACKKAPASILERLLALSPTLVIEGEVTPVQAWNHIRQQPQFERLATDGLLVLTKRLSETVKCHGFGAVFKEDVFQKLLREVFAKWSKT